MDNHAGFDCQKGSEMNFPDFKSYEERDKFFREHAEYFTVMKKVGRGYARDECKTLAEAKALAQTKQTIGGGKFLIYAVIGEQSAFVEGV